MQLSKDELAALSGLLDQGLDLPEDARGAWLDGLSEPFPGAKPLLAKVLAEDARGGGDAFLDTLPKIATETSTGSAQRSALQTGFRIGIYVLMREIGQGGMATVWLARRTDELTQRPIALKLPHLHLQSARHAERFARERDILANLTHPHIAHLYDAGFSPEGQPFLAMEFVAGEPLTEYCAKHELGLDERLQLFLQVVAAVDYAHSQGVIHRDLKPSNILVRDGGEVVLLDFGIAKLIVEGQAEQTELSLHGGGALSPHYASPEQIKGEVLGPATDVYSLGVLLYELLCGQRPYELTGSTRSALEQAILSTEPRRPSEVVTQRTRTAETGPVPEMPRHRLRGDLDTIVLKALKKSPAERYPSAGAYSEDLQRYLRGDGVSARPDSLTYRIRKLAFRQRSALKGAVLAGVAVAAVAFIVAVNDGWGSRHTASAMLPAAPPTTQADRIDPKSVAVLPFVDMSEKKDQEYFSDGLSEELIDRLAHTPDLKVIARTSSFQFKGKNEDMRTIGQKLGVANLLEGSVRKSDKTLRVTAQLIKVSDGSHLWSETYDLDVGNIFKIQDEIATAVVAALKVQLNGGSASLRGHGTSNPEAYNAYLLGRQFASQGTIPTWRQAIAAYQKAIGLDPHYADAYADLAGSEYMLAENLGDVALWQLAEQSAQKAIDLDPHQATGYVIKGALRYLHRYDWVGAEADLKQALTLDPTNSRALSQYGKLLSYVGRNQEAAAMLRKAIEVDPLQYAIWQNLGIALAKSGDHAGAYDAFHHELAIQPGSTHAAFALGTLQLVDGKAHEALTTFQSNSDGEFRGAGVAMAEHTLGDAKASQQALEKLIATGAADAAYQIAEVYAWRGERDQAFDWLERAYRQQDGGLAGIKNDLRLASLRSDPRYAAMLRKLNFPPDTDGNQIRIPVSRSAEPSISGSRGIRSILPPALRTLGTGLVGISPRRMRNPVRKNQQEYRVIDGF